jgi:hypothetical protein
LSCQRADGDGRHLVASRVIAGRVSPIAEHFRQAGDGPADLGKRHAGVGRRGVVRAEVPDVVEGCPHLLIDDPAVPAEPIDLEFQLGDVRL